MNFRCLKARPSFASLLAALKDCRNPRDLERVNAIQAMAKEMGEESNIFLANSLVHVYAKCGDMTYARRTFDEMQKHSLVSWNALIFGYAENGEGQKALEMLSCMQSQSIVPDSRTFVAALKACSDLALKEQGKLLDGKLVKVVSGDKGMAIHSQAALLGSISETLVTNTLLDVYAKCGRMNYAHRTFESISQPTVVTWTALVMGYADNGEGQLGLEAFRSMQRQGYLPNRLTFVAALKASALIAALVAGRAIHAEVVAYGLHDDPVVATSLIDFYGKCGSISNAEQVFHSLSTRDSTTWNALMAGYARLGDTQLVFGLFNRMQDEEGLSPDEVTFLCILTACSHAGLVDKCREYFDVMASKHGISPRREHFVCMVDCFGRSGQLEAALATVKSMPFEPDTVTWRTLLGACRKWKNVEVGRIAFESLIKLDNEDQHAYGLMTNIYGSRGLWELQAEVEAMRREARAWRKVGRSWWTDHNGLVHNFVVGDRSHAQSSEIHAKIKLLLAEMKLCGYVPDTSAVPYNICDDDKEDLLSGHSEKLAVACALINTSPGTTIRVTKNLRVCEDCHWVIAAVSKIEQRTIICRDANRFHVFAGGECSCHGFW